MKDTKDKILEIAEIAKACPENLQAICFETLLKHFLAGLAPAPAKSKKEEPATPPKDKDAPGANDGADAGTAKQEDIRDSDLHMKARRFMQKESVTLEQLNGLFYREGDQVRPLFDDLKTTRMAESQIRIALLQCLVHALTTGDFDTDVESVRAECIQRKCYDLPNFAANFKKNNTLFDFDKFDRATKTVRLSDTGRKELANVVKELQ
jgi:hypothetical protein